MKKLIFLILFVVPFLASAEDNPKPLKKANVIIIERKDSAMKFLVDYSVNLRKHGFTVDRLDKDLMQITTNPKQYKFGGLANMKIIASSRQEGEIAIIEITGTTTVMSLYGNADYQICNCGLIGDVRLNAFNEIQSTLENMKIDKIQFEKRN